MARYWFLALLLVFSAIPAWAWESPSVTSPRATVSLVTETDQVAPGQPFRLGLRFRLAPGWHIYWSNPGDAGTPPDLALTLSPGGQAGDIAWPAPVRLPQGPVMSFGYRGNVLLPVTVIPSAAPSALDIEAKASWLVCHEDCIPEEGVFRLTLASGRPAPSAEAPLFADADRRMPVSSPFPATITADGRLSLSGVSAASVHDAWFFPAVWGQVDQSAAQPLEKARDSLSLALKPGPEFKPDAPLTGVLVIDDPSGGQSFLSVTAHPGAASNAPAWRMLGLALLGGLVLNLMPCVFPILAIKAMAVAQLSGAQKAIVRAQGLAYLAGVLIAFAALAAVTLAARATGQALGWGGQFQSPAFVAAMAWLLFAIGLNLSGVFSLGQGVAGIGQDLTQRKGMVGSLFTGLLAVVVATPCTAPFMGAAIATAITQRPPLLVATFLALGLGFAAPFAVLAAAPSLATLLPRPGRWMDVLKQTLAFPMYAAAGWLIWVESRQSGSDGLALAIAGVVLVGMACWAWGQAQAADGGWGRRLAGVASVAAVLTAAVVLAGLGTASVSSAAATGGEAAAEKFSAARLAALRAEGRPVFVNMTASWCVICLVNERVALGTETVRHEFARRGIDYLKGDWTRRDPEITAFLREHARDGVPLYVFYPGGHAPPSVLPQILTEATVLTEIDHTAN